MSRFTQLHLLTPHPASNLNRDDTGRPKTIIYAEKQRLRISSQCQKRNWRVSDVFANNIKNNDDSKFLGIRTRTLGVYIYEKLTHKDIGIKEDKAKKIAKQIANAFAPQDERKENKDTKKPTKEKDKDKQKKIKKELTTQLVHLSLKEKALVDELVNKKIADHNFEPTEKDLELLREDSIDVDIALWGRMLASSPNYNIEAACQVAHAFSVDAVTIEDDYFTALDDLNDGTEDSGAGHVDDAAFGSGLFYSYICINNDLLLDNLGGNKELAEKTIKALIQAATTVTPSGKQNSFASRAYACYGLVEVGDQQPRSLALSYLKPISSRDENYAELAIAALEDQRAKFDQVYGKCSDNYANFNALTGEGSLASVSKLATGVFA